MQSKLNFTAIDQVEGEGGGGGWEVGGIFHVGLMVAVQT